METKSKSSNLEEVKNELKMSSDLAIADEASQNEIQIITTQEELRREFRSKIVEY
jgi:hypothetical protein